MTSIPIPNRVAERAATRFVVSGEHHISTYSVASHGYAQIGWFDGEKMRGTTAHRAAWAHYHGDPGEMTVDHRNWCGERACVKEEHLRALSNLENARRTEGRDWELGRCANGHDHATQWRAKGPTRKKGYCHACRMEIQRNRRARAKGV